MADISFSKERVQALKERMGGSTSGPAEAAAESSFPAEGEPMLVHPGNQSIIKLRDNGCIDIFSGDNQGIRVDPANKTINFMSKTLKNHAETIRSIVTKDVVYEVKKAWSVKADNVTINTEGNTQVNAKGKLDLKSEGAMKIEAASLDINVKGKLKAFASDYDWT